MHRRQQSREQFHVSVAMDSRDLDCRMTWAHSSKALPSSLASLWITVLPRPPRQPFTPEALSKSRVPVRNRREYADFQQEELTSSGRDHCCNIHPDI